MAFSSVLDTIGNTPLVALDRVYPGPGKLYAKLEFLNPGGSVKDRAALKVIREALQTGALSPGQPVVEMTSGNMGCALALVCNVTGNPFIAVMSAGNSPERRTMMRNLGAELVLAPQVDGTPGHVTGEDIAAAARLAVEIERERHAYYVNQFHNPWNVLAHETTTGPEIWKELGERLDAFVALVGSGASFIGTARFLKKQKPGVVCAVVEPQGAEILAGKPVTKPLHLLQGGGYAQIVPQWQPELADVFLSVSDDEATLYRHLLSEKEGMYVGYTAAANVCAAIKLMKSGSLGKEPVVATLLCDTGLKYSTI